MSTSHQPSPAVYVGQGLTERSFEDCVAEGLNPNPNPPGEIFLPQDHGASMRAHIKRSQTFALRALRREG